MRRYGILLESRAKREIDDAVAWWADRSPARAMAIGDELARAYQLHERCPDMGRLVVVKRRPKVEVRRVVLARVGYHLYYRVDHMAEVVIGLSFWHEKRRAPRL